MLRGRRLVPDPSTHRKGRRHVGINITINGSPGPEGFLVAPAGGQQSPALIGLKTDDGATVQATLEVTAPAGVVVQLGRRLLQPPARDEKKTRFSVHHPAPRVRHFSATPSAAVVWHSTGVRS